MDRDLEQGADINARNENGSTPLLLAVSNGNVNIAELLITQGADINARNSDGNTPLRLALDSQNIDWSIVESLIEKGADINTQNSDGNTPLRLALDSQNIDWSIVESLIEKGADINTVNRSGETTLSLILNFQCIDSTGHEALLSQLSILLDYAANPKNKELEEIFDRIRLVGEFLHGRGESIISLFASGMMKASKSGNDESARKMNAIVSTITYTSELGSVNNAQVTNYQTNQQQESGAQASCAQFSQQQEPNAHDQPGPSSSLSEVPPISRSQSLNSLHSDDSGTKIDESSQCR